MFWRRVIWFFLIAGGALSAANADPLKLERNGCHSDANSQIAYDFKFANSSNHTVFYGVAGESMVYRVESRRDSQADWVEETGHFGWCGNGIGVKSMPGGSRPTRFSVVPRLEGWQEFRVCVVSMLDRANGPMEQTWSPVVHRQ